MHPHTYGLSLSLRLAAILALVISLIVPAFISGRTSAAQITSRSIKMSSSILSATTVDYEVSFKVGTTTPTLIKGFVVEFCDDSPILAVSCDTTAGTIPSISSVATPTTGLSGTTSLTGTWTGSGTGTGTFKMTNATGTTLDDGDANPVMFKFQATNPTTSTGTSGHAFYARIYTYVSDTGGSSPAGHTGGVTTGTYLDAGGAALSTANAINITAKVQETLTFCVSKAQPTSGCGGVTTPDLLLGTGTPKVLTTGSAASQEDFAYFQVSTNAAGNVIVRLKGDILRSGSNNITPTGGTTPFVITAGTANFGMRIGTTTGAANDYSASGVTIDANYLHATSYGWDTSAINTGYGDPIATISASQDSYAKLNFGATVSVTTPAGLYTATENLIATGTY